LALIFHLAFPLFLFQFDSGYPMPSRDISHHFGIITVFSHTDVARIYMYFKSSKVLENRAMSTRRCTEKCIVMSFIYLQNENRIN
jgi:hypothetical protein